MGIKKYKDLILVGTSHIAIESVQTVEKVILEEKPDFVAVELDKKRFVAMMSGAKRKAKWKDIRQIGVKGFLFNLFGAWVEDKLGKMVGIKPGSDMKKAIECARKVDARLALVDQDIAITLKRLSKEITWKEKWCFVKEFFQGLILRKRGVIDFDLTKVPSDKVIQTLTKKLKRNYPSLYKVLIVERNKYMAKALYKLMSLEPKNKIVAIVGAGHEDDLIKLIKNENKIHNKRS